MGDQFAIVDGTTVNAGGNGVTQDFTDPLISETVDAAIIILIGATADDSSAVHARMSLGFVSVSGSVNRCIGWRAEDNRTAGGARLNTPASNTRCGILLASGGNTSVAECSFNSTIAGGIRLTWDVQPDAQYKIVVVLLAGLTNATAGSQSATSTEATLGGGLGYRPGGVLYGCGGLTFSNPFTANVDIENGVGGSVDDASPPSEASIYGHWDTTTPTDADAIAETDRSGGESLDGTTFSPFQTTLFEATGARIQGDNVGPSPDLMFLALQVAAATRRMRVALEVLPGSTGPASFTGLGIRPALVIGCANLLAASDTITDGATASTWTLFAFTPTQFRAAAIHHQEGITPSGGTPSDANTRCTNKPLLVLNHVGAIAAEATLIGVTATGFDLNFSAATAGRMFVFAIGDVPSITFGPRRPAFWKAVLRNRRLAQQRRRWKPLVPGREIFVGEPTTEESKGRIFTPGLVRGRISGAGTSLPDDE